MSNSIKIKATFQDLNSAIDAAKAAGNDIFGGFENNIADHRRSDKRCGVTEYFLTEKNHIIYVAVFGKRKCLNMVSLHSSIDNADLKVAQQHDDAFSIVPLLCVAKSNHEVIKAIENAELLLIDQDTAAKITSDAFDSACRMTAFKTRQTAVDNRDKDFKNYVEDLTLSLAK
tara:strand:- start:53 stop:568 length:516 start_codon:yes stop_codon:yes gene_type:complete